MLGAKLSLVSMISIGPFSTNHDQNQSVYRSKLRMVVCPNFRHLALTSSFTKKNIFWQMKKKVCNNFEWTVINMAVFFLIPCKKWFVQCTLQYMRTLNKSLFTRSQKHTAMYNWLPCTRMEMMSRRGSMIGKLVLIFAVVYVIYSMQFTQVIILKIRNWKKSLFWVSEVYFKLIFDIFTHLKKKISKSVYFYLIFLQQTLYLRLIH